MQLAHIACWTNEPERLRDFYVSYFDGKSNEKYVNPAKGFSSYFVSFKTGASLEIMQRTDIHEACEKPHIGLTHIAFQAASNEEVDSTIERFRQDGYTIYGEPRFTGDGYYEGAILDPDGNIVEIVTYKDITITSASSYPYDLLLLADPDRDTIDQYLPSSDCFIAMSGDAISGVIVVQKQDEDRAEVMNLAVDESFQRRGIARKLLRFVGEQWCVENKIKHLIIRTGTSAPGPLMLYQQEGFDLKKVDYDYFVRNYKDPIWENGVQCKHQLILEKNLD
jgi:catechol 2,3-dioxygenase-like lactoylglutathione lyase family enzyme